MIHPPLKIRSSAGPPQPIAARIVSTDNSNLFGRCGWINFAYRMPPWFWLVVLLLPHAPQVAAENQTPFDPFIEAASDQGEKAMAGFTLDERFQVDLFAAEPMLANPIAFCFDSQGRLFVVESFRYGHAPEATNAQEDLACRTVADRVAMHRRKHGEKSADYAQRHERIRLIEDTDADGRADRATVFADGFNSLETAVAAGILATGDDILLTCIPDLWLLRDTDQDGRADRRKSLSHGYGVHVGFQGHDMHGPLLYVDGRIYWTIGDRGFHVETADGVISSPDRGAVLRCNLDGSGLEIYHTGLRNPQDLTYDEYGNLFTGDNNSDGGDAARIVYVVQGGDSGWHMGLQYMSNKTYLRGPWNAERLWHLPFKGQSASLVPPVAHVGNGPAGVAFYPGTGLDSHYRGHMFLCDYNGSAARTGVYAFRFRPRGASFELDNLHKFLWGLSCSDVGFGPEGLYVADWAASWNPADKGRIYCVSNPDPAARAAAAGTQKLLARGMAERDSEQLAALLAYSDQRVRLAAQLALVENGEDGLAAMQRIAHDSDEPLARLHAIWGLGIAGRSRPARLEPLLPLLADADDEVRGQTAQIMGEARYTVAVENMLPLLSDNSSRVRMLAAIALGKLGDPRAREPLLALLRENADRDPYLRHGAVMGLSLLGDADAIAAHRHDPNPSVRLGVLLALRRMGDRRVADFLKDPSAQLVTEAARAINDLPIRASRPQLAALIAPYLQDEGQRPENLPLGEPLLRRILNANFREGGNQNARSLLQFLAQRANSDAMRREAAAALADWRQPGPLDRVVGLSRPLASRSGRLVVQLLEDSAVKLLRGGGPALREDLIRLLGLYEISTGNDVLAQWVTDSEQTSAIRVAAMQMLAHLEDGRTVGLLERAMKDRNPALRIAAGRLLAERDPERAAELLISVVDRSETKRERQQALAALATIFRPEVDASLARWLDELIEENFPKTLQLDLIEAATDRNDPEVIRKLENYQNSFSPLDPLAPYRAAIHGGNYERGRELFIGRMEVNCLRCHQVKTVGGTAGPALTRVGIEKTREQLLESIVLPNAKITKGYETTVITTDEGRLISGIVQSEDDQWVRLLTPERQLIDIAVHSIDDRFSGKSAMPEEMHKHLDKFDLRDLVEFLYQLGRRPQDR